MRVLVLGGTRFIGEALVARLLGDGDEVTVFSRTRPSRAHPGLKHVCGDSRRAPGLSVLAASGGFDCAVNTICMDAEDAAEHVRYVAPLCRRSIVLSSIGVYGPANDFPEEDRFRPEEPASRPPDLGPAYLGKREAESVLARALGPSLKILRPAVVLGRNDWTRRLAFYVGRLLDGNGIITSDDGTRFLSWTTESQVSAVLRDMVRAWPAFRFQAYNVAQAERILFRDLLRVSASAAGLRSFPLLSLKRHRLPIPFPEFRDPYGKEPSTCGVARLAELDPAYTLSGRKEWGRLSAEAAGSLLAGQLPDAGNRGREADFLARHRDYIETVGL